MGALGTSVGVSLAENYLSNTVTASVEDSSVTALGSGTIIIDADAIQTIEANSSVVSVSVALGGLAGAGASAVTDISSDVEAFARNATLTAAGNLVQIDADSEHTADATAFGLAASTTAGVSVVNGNANIGGATRAFADGTMNVTAAAMDVTADSIANALPDVTSVALSLGGAGSGAIVSATIDRTTEAYVGARAGTVPAGTTNLMLTGGPLTIDANSTFTAIAAPLNFGLGAGITVAVTLTEAIIEGNTLAYIGESSSVTASSVSVSAASTEVATSETITIALDVAGAAVSVTSATSQVLSNTEAFIGTRVGEASLGAATSVIVTGAGALSVDATASRTAVADTLGSAITLGVLAVDVSLPTAEVGGRTVAGMDGEVSVEAGDVDVVATASNLAEAEALVLSLSVVGIGGSGADVLAVVNETADVEAVVGSDVTLTADHILVDAHHIGDQNTALAKALGGAGGQLGGLAVMLAEAYVEGGVRAELNANVIGSDSVTVTANGRNLAQADTLAVAIGLGFGASGTGTVSEVTDTADVVARIGADASITTSGAVLVTATGDNDALSNSDAGSGGTVSVSGSALGATVAGAVIAEMNGDLFNATALDVIATGDNYAAADALAISVGIASGSGADAYAEITADADVQAKVGSTAELTMLWADINVLATGTNEAQASAAGGGIGGLSINVMLPEAIVGGGVLAEYSGQTLAQVASLNVEALGDNWANAETLVGNISLLGGAGANANAVITSDAEVQAHIGAAGLVDTFGTVLVDARLQGNMNLATANAVGAVGGALAGVSVMLATAEVGGSVIADVDGEISGASRSIFSQRVVTLPWLILLQAALVPSAVPVAAWLLRSLNLRMSSPRSVIRHR